MRSRLLCSSALVLLLAAASCSSGSDGKKDASASSTTTSSTTTTIKVLAGDEVDASASPYCAVWAKIRTAGGAKLTGDPNTDTAARKEHYAKLVPLTQDLVAKAPDELADAVKAALALVQEVARTGAADSFADPEAQRYQQQLAKYALDHCAKG